MRLQVRLSEEEEERLVLLKESLGEESYSETIKHLISKERTLPKIGKDMNELAHCLGALVAQVKIIASSDYNLDEIKDAQNGLKEYIEFSDSILKKYSAK